MEFWMLKVFIPVEQPDESSGPTRKIDITILILYIYAYNMCTSHSHLLANLSPTGTDILYTANPEARGYISAIHA